MELQDNDNFVIQAMDRYGGGFVRALARAASLADADNLARLKAAWPEYWAQYAEIARLHTARIDKLTENRN